MLPKLLTNLLIIIAVIVGILVYCHCWASAAALFTINILIPIHIIAYRLHTS